MKKLVLILIIFSFEKISTCQVIKKFPLDSSVYYDDINSIKQKTVAQYGKSEWVSGVITNELHHHLGIYAIIGVKMGMRALDYLGAEAKHIKVISHAGLIPPVSCMNDGLQVSTGATLGHGLISVSTDSLKFPAADFTYLGKTIYITLKADISKKISKEVKELNHTYGLDSKIYWKKIRLLAIKYWADFNRNEIFNVKEIIKK